MTESELKNMLNRTNEIELIVTGRKSGREISRPVWFVYEANILYLLPVQGSDTEWYKNVQKNPNMKISVDGQEITGKARPITDANKVKEVTEKFRSKYGDSDVKKYYTKFDVGVEFALQ
jgi:deazaflavin-dependent oxidoreductase (nitroreductase family)